MTMRFRFGIGIERGGHERNTQKELLLSIVQTYVLDMEDTHAAFDSQRLKKVWMTFTLPGWGPRSPGPKVITEFMGPPS